MNETKEVIEMIFGELQSKFNMKMECLELDKFEKIKEKWLKRSQKIGGKEE